MTNVISLKNIQKKIIDCDWLREMQFLGNTVHKKGKEIAQIAQIALALRAGVILLVFEKIYSCLFIPNCTRNHVITCTNVIRTNSWEEIQLLFGNNS